MSVSGIYSHGHNHDYKIALKDKDVEVNKTTIFRTFQCNVKGCKKTYRRTIRGKKGK